jgi:hypothetical protein
MMRDRAYHRHGSEASRKSHGRAGQKPLSRHILTKAFRATGISGKLQGCLPFCCSSQEDFKEVLRLWKVIK